MGESGHLQSNAVQRKLPTPRSVEVHRLNYTHWPRPLTTTFLSSTSHYTPSPHTPLYTPELYPLHYTPLGSTSHLALYPSLHPPH